MSRYWEGGAWWCKEAAASAEDAWRRASVQQGRGTARELAPPVCSTVTEFR